MGIVDDTRSRLQEMNILMSHLPQDLRVPLSKRIMWSLADIDAYVNKVTQPVSVDEVAAEISEAARLQGWDPITWGYEAYGEDGAYQAVNPGTKEFAEHLLKKFRMERHG